MFSIGLIILHSLPNSEDYENKHKNIFNNGEENIKNELEL